MSARSVVDVCNVALSTAGARASISNLAENSPEARMCQLHYDLSLSVVLRSAHWNFARKQVALAVLKDATKTPPDSVPTPWLYSYALPADCVLARYVLPTVQLNTAYTGQAQVVSSGGAPMKWIIALDQDATGNDVKVILTNQPSAILVYTAKVTNTALWDEQFTMAMCEYLSARLSIPVNGDKAMAVARLAAANQMAIEARRTNGNEGLTVIDNTPDWIAVRGYSADWASPPGSMFVTQPQAMTLVI